MYKFQNPGKNSVSEFPVSVPLNNVPLSVLYVQTKVSLQVAPQLQVLCTPYSPCISLPFSSFSRPFARPLYDFIFLLPMLHPAECLVARCIKRTFYRFFLSLSFSSPLFSTPSFSFVFFVLFTFTFSSRCAIGPIVALETETKVKGVCLRSNLKETIGPTSRDRLDCITVIK